MKVLEIIGRSEELMMKDLRNNENKLSEEVSSSRFLVIGGAGSIGQAVVKEIFVRDPLALHVVDLSENNLVELVRDLRSSRGYITGDFRTYAIDCGAMEFERLVTNEGPYDYVLNLSALKHVRSEKDPYTLIRMIETNILNTIKTVEIAIRAGAKKYFCVSTDKAANPANMMGASKRIMEMFLLSMSDRIDISMARFANVAFSDGSLLQGFNRRIEKRQPIAAPSDIRRYFVTPSEAGRLCLMAAIFGNGNEIFFPKLSEELNLITFSSIAERYLRTLGYEPRICKTEDEARSLFSVGTDDGSWPCVFTQSDTSGEKEYEEFFMDGEDVDLDRYDSLGVVTNSQQKSDEDLSAFMNSYQALRSHPDWNKDDFVTLFNTLLPEFSHKETGKNLDNKM